MGWLRTAMGVFAMLHGMAHLTWFVGAFVPRAELVDAESWLFSTGVTITGSVGKLFGALSLVVVVGFVATGVGLLRQREWATRLLLISAIVSVIVVVPWWSVSPGATVINALVADTALVAISVVPALREFAHLPSTDGNL